MPAPTGIGIKFLLARSVENRRESRPEWQSAGNEDRIELAGMIASKDDVVSDFFQILQAANFHPTEDVQAQPGWNPDGFLED